MGAGWVFFRPEQLLWSVRLYLPKRKMMRLCFLSPSSLPQPHMQSVCLVSHLIYPILANIHLFMEHSVIFDFYLRTQMCLKKLRFAEISLEHYLWALSSRLFPPTRLLALQTRSLRQYLPTLFGIACVHSSSEGGLQRSSESCPVVWQVLGSL